MATPETDGFGQTLLDDLRFAVRFWRAAGMPVTWRRPTPAEAARIEADPVMSRFGDTTVAVATVNGQNWVIGERDWWGWPDPPRYVFFALRSTVIEIARDLHVIPRAWIMPPG